MKGIGVNWVRHIDRTYDVGKMRDTLSEALTTKESGPKVIVASSECMLNKQRREKPLFQKAIERGRAHGAASASASTRMSAPAITPASGSPAVRRCRSSTSTIRCSDDPVAAIDNNCVGCGNCGEVAEAAVLCPSFYRADIIHNPTWFDRFIAGAAARGDRLPAAAARAPARSLSPTDADRET